MSRCVFCDEPLDGDNVPRDCDMGDHCEDCSADCPPCRAAKKGQR
jgi:hypothetical protein